MPTDPLPTSLSDSDLTEIERETVRIGRDLLARATAAEPTMVSPTWWLEQAGELATADDELKVRLFRLVDCMPMLDDAASLDRHVREYLDEELAERLPGSLGFAIRAARSGILAPLASRIVRAAVHAQAKRFISGTTPEEAAATARRQRAARRGFSLDLLGEAVTSDAEADSYAASYADLLTRLPPLAAEWPADPLIDEGPDGLLPRVNVSIKLSALDSQFDAIDPQGTQQRVLSRLRPLWRLAREHGCQVHIDMESRATKDLAMTIFKTIAMEEEFRDWPHVGVVVQCYLRDAAADLAGLAEWARGRGTPIWVRLVKGAYWDYETIHARAAGWPVPVWQEKQETDACYEACTRFTIEHANLLRPAIGSHNLRSLAHAMALVGHLGIDRRTLEIQMLYGMGDSEKTAVTGDDWRLRVYMPYGQLVPGMAYLVRRLLENSSNESFLRAGFVQHADPESLFAPPRPAEDPAPQPAAAPPGGFANEPHADFTLAENRRAMAAAIDEAAALLADELRGGDGPTVPVIIDGRREPGGGFFERRDPSQTSQLVARVAAATPDQARRACLAADAGRTGWADLPADARTAAIRRAASIMRQRRWLLAALQVLEVGKGWREADADVAEAIDFCDYYADVAERMSAPRIVDVPGEHNATGFRPRGVAVVIAPWNFPLAILTGMSTAALVTGNTVVMKPAEQSSRIGLALYEILLEAGVPASAVHFLPGRGEEIGPPLVTDPATAIVAFTGSREVGLAINTQAAEASAAHGRAVTRVIAEMGGKNAIIVDDDADLDEAVLGIVASSFGFQGQKCSAASRVIAVGGVHDPLLARLRGAVESLRIGPARDPGSRIGPLVDEEARDRVARYVEIGRREGRVVAGVDPGPLADRGWYVGPHVFADVDPEGPLGQEEIFGPILAIFRAESFESAVRLANGTPYALTAGIFSRSPRRLEEAAATLEAGNVYLNRGTTGALVNRQPFGGYRLSGIGSKAGGPDYLLQFVVPRTVTENTMRRGFAPDIDDEPRAQP